MRRCSGPCRASSRRSAPSLDAHHATNVAVAVLDNRTGEWLAWEGSGDYFDTDHGGAIDGVVDAAAAGIGAEAVHVRGGVRARHRLRRACWPTCRRSSRPPSPACSTARATTTAEFRGPLLARAALAGSENVPAVALASEIGVPAGRAAAPARRVLDARRQRGALRPRPDARQRGGAARRARRRLRDVRARRRVATAADRSARSTAARRRRRAPSARVSTRTAFWITDILVGRRRARVHLRPRRQPRVSVPGRREDRHVAVVPRQLGDRLHARRHGRRLGRQLRSHAAARTRRA